MPNLLFRDLATTARAMQTLPDWQKEYIRLYDGLNREIAMLRDAMRQQTVAHQRDRDDWSHKMASLSNPQQLAEAAGCRLRDLTGNSVSVEAVLWARKNIHTPNNATYEWQIWCSAMNEHFHGATLEEAEEAATAAWNRIYRLAPKTLLAALLTPSERPQAQPADDETPTPVAPADASDMDF